jgi:hypothetical protein
MVRGALLALSLVLLLPAQARAQQGIRELTGAEISQIVKDSLKAAGSDSVELEGVAKLTWKPITEGTDALARRVGNYYAQVNEAKKINLDRDAAAQKYRDQVQESFNQALEDSTDWKLELLVDAAWKGKKLPRGEYRVSPRFEGEQLKSLRLVALEKPTEKPADDAKPEKPKKPPPPVVVSLDLDKKQTEPCPRLGMTLRAIADKKTGATTAFELDAVFAHTTSRTKEPLKIDKPRDAKPETKPETTKDEPKDEKPGTGEEKDK